MFLIITTATNLKLVILVALTLKSQTQIPAWLFAVERSTYVVTNGSEAAARFRK